ncbi:MAG: hypothetical protein ACKVW3_06135 [Phycisphaerales bacterium]
MTQTTVHKPWLLKMVVFAAVLLFFGGWGYFDATIKYPARGIRHAQFCEYQYLDTALSAKKSDPLGVADPEAEYRRLQQSPPDRMENTDKAKMEWLRSLSLVGRLKPEFTRIEDSTKRHQELKAEWTAGAKAKASPKPLAGYDIPVQWVFVVIGFGGGLYLLTLIVVVAGKKYRWEEATKTLTLPGGATLTPGDIEEFDKRKWDKFLIFLQIKPGHPRLGGKEIRLDLLRHHPLEPWVLEMERIAFPERAEATPTAEAGEASEASKV